MFIECSLKKGPTHKNALFLLQKIILLFSLFIFLSMLHSMLFFFFFSFSWAPKSLQMVTAAMKLKDACSLEEKL